MKRKQGGFSLIENLVSITLLGIVASGFIASSVAAVGMKNTGLQRSAATRAASTAMEPVFYQRGSRIGLQAALAGFPKSITESGTHKTYIASIASVRDYAGATIDPATLPAHGVIVITLSVPYSGSPGNTGTAAQTKTITPSYTMEF